MNVLPLIFALLVLLSLGYLSSFEVLRSSRVLDRTYREQTLALRGMHRKLETLRFKRLSGKSIALPSTEPSASKEKERKPRPEPINPFCARLNLLPLIREGKENHPALYRLASHFLPPALLDSWLVLTKALLDRYPDQPPLEKIAFEDAATQRLYYQLLQQHLLDYIKVDESPSRVCLGHANRSMLTKLFNAAAAERILQERKEKVLDAQRFEALCKEFHIFCPKDLLDITFSRHQRLRDITLQEKRLRQKFYFERQSTSAP